MSAGPGTRVIAHRGASGYLPEHTLPAKSLAYGLGADFLEQDLVATRDRRLVVLHDLWLDDISDVARVAPERLRADGHYYAVDFDLAELEQLRLHERKRPGTDVSMFPERFGVALDGFRVVSLRDELALIHELNRTTGRRVGIYPELKAPSWHRELGIDVAGMLLDDLEASGWAECPELVFLQSFDAAELRRLKDALGTELPLIQLLDFDDAAGLATDAAALDAIAAYAAGVGLPYRALLADPALEPSQLCRGLQDTGLLIHPYTFRRDVEPAPAASFEALLEFFMHELAVDALFCDQPDVAVRCRERRGPP